MEDTVLEGTVRDEDMEGLPGVVIAAEPQGGGGQRDAVTTENGRYRILGLKGGAYTVTASLEGFDTEKRQIDLRDGKTTTLNFTLQAPMEPPRR